MKDVTSESKRAVGLLPGPLTPSIAPAAPSERNFKVSTTGLVTSRNWTVPPKPKKGPKKAVKDIVGGHKNSARRQLIKAKPTDHNMKAENPPQGKTRSSNISVNTGLTPSPGLYKADDAQEVELSLDCGLCDAGGDCACDALGIKPNFNINRPDESPVFGISFEPFVAQKAVPLSRKPSRASSPKYWGFKRLKTDSSSSTGTNTSLKRQQQKPEKHSCSFCGSLETSCVCGSDTEESQSFSHPYTHTHAHVHAPPASVRNASPITEKSYTEIKTPAVADSPKFSPGGCPTCMSDPLCTLFCLSLSSADKGAASLENSPLTISCSQTYKSLSRHQGFKRQDLGLIINNLKSHNGKVDVQSIATAMRDLEQHVQNEQQQQQQQ